jgi:hypothetical protein
LAYKRWSLTIAEDRGQPDIFGVTLGVTLSALFELPPCYAFDAKNRCESPIFIVIIRLSRILIRFRVPHYRIGRERRDSS